MNIVGDEVLTNQSINYGLRAWVNAQRGQKGSRSDYQARAWSHPCCIELRTASEGTRPPVGHPPDRHQDRRKATSSDLQKGLPNLLGADPR